jgi:thioester reductase-like protein
VEDELILVTGFPALEARKLVEHVLSNESETRLALVVLPKLLETAERHIGKLEPEARARVEVLEGDAAAIDMGLSGTEIRSLARRVTRIHHVAHLGYVGVDRETAQMNVQGAVEAVEIARCCDELRCLVHHSTAHVSGDREGTVYEEELDEGQTFHSIVQETRMTAELVMRRAMADLPITVVRPTMIVGDSGTGEADRLDGAYLLVMLLLGLPGDMAVPLPTGSDNPLDIVPIDYVVKAARWIGLQKEATSRTFHLASSEGLTAQQVFDAIARAGGRRTTRSVIPPQVAAALFRTPGVARFVHEPRALVQQLATNARYDVSQARRILAGSGIICPPLESYVATMVTTVEERFRDRHVVPERAAPEP